MTSTGSTIASRESPRGGFLRRNLAWTLFLLMLAVFVAGRFVGPRIPEGEQIKWCAVNVRITAIFGVSLNCDSPEFMRDAIDLSALLEPKSPLQSKPGGPLVARLVSLPFRPLNALGPRVASDVRRTDIDPARVDNALRTFAPAYAAYFVLNMLILAGSFHLFRRIHRLTRPDVEPAPLAVLSASLATLMIATYPLTNYILSPHTQMLNTFIPLWAVVCAMRANAGALTDGRFAARIGAIVGLGTTAYALFPVVTMTVLLFAGLHARRERPTIRRAALVRNAVLLVLMSIAPVIAWYAFVKLTTGQFYDNEVERSASLIWMVRALGHGPTTLLAEFLHRLGFYAAGLVSLLPGIALTAAVTAGFLTAARRRIWGEKDIRRLLADAAPTVRVALIVSLTFLAFYVIVGQFMVRHSYAAIPPIVAALGVVATALADRLPARWARSYAAGCAGIAVVVLAHGIAEGPHVPGNWFD